MMPSLPFDWDRYLVYSQVIVSMKAEEAAYRIATSRAYYAAYWKARQILETSGIVFPMKRSHEFCWNSFSAVYNQDGEQVCKLGIALRDRRVHADYKDRPPLSQKSADSDVQDAAEIINALNTLSDEQKRTAAARADQIMPNFV